MPQAPIVALIQGRQRTRVMASARVTTWGLAKILEMWLVTMLDKRSTARTGA